MDKKVTFCSFLVKTLALLILVGLMGCSRTMYGVPEQEWLKLSDEQKSATISGYNERERLREQTRAIEAERRAKVQAEKAEEQRRQQEITQRRIEAIYAGEAGNIGDLIRVSIQEGDMLFGNKRRPFQPMTFKLASGETRTIQVVSNDKNYNDSAELTLSYRDGMLLIDEAEFRPDLAFRVVYDSAWKRGSVYIINSRGYRALHNVRLNVEVIPHLRRH